MASSKELQKDFKHLIDGDRVAHGYIFFGAGGIGKNGKNNKLTLAYGIANYCERGSWEGSEKLLTDLMIINAADDGGIDLVRAAIKFLWQKPVNSPKRVFIIDEADYLTLPAQQAILKIAEEPPPHTLLILILNNPDALIPPLVSRFQKIFFSGRENPGRRKQMELSEFSQDFLGADQKRRREIIKEVIQDKHQLDRFLADIIMAAYRDRLNNATLLGNIMRRLRFIKQYNTNKKIQLEAALMEMPIINNRK